MNFFPTLHNWNDQLQSSSGKCHLLKIQNGETAGFFSISYDGSRAILVAHEACITTCKSIMQTQSPEVPSCRHRSTCIQDCVKCNAWICQFRHTYFTAWLRRNILSKQCSLFKQFIKWWNCSLKRKSRSERFNQNCSPTFENTDVDHNWLTWPCLIRAYWFDSVSLTYRQSLAFRSYCSQSYT